MGKHKSKGHKKASKAMKKAKKHGPVAAALAVVVGELVAAVKRADLDKRLVDYVVDVIDRRRAERHDDSLATA